MDDLQYIDDPFEEDWNFKKPPKWKIPQSSNEKMILSSVDQMYYKTRGEKTEVIKITKAMMSLSTGVVSQFPTEWIEFCCAWAREKRKHRQYVQLKGLIGFIHNEDAKREFLEKRVKDKPKSMLFTSMED